MDNAQLLATVKQMLQAAPAYWMTLARTVPLDLLTQPPAEGEWSALECLQHLIDTEQVFQSRIQAFLEGRDFPGFFPDEEGTRLDGPPSAEALAGEFSLRRQTGLQIVNLLTPDDLDRRARHQELGPVSLSEMLHEWVGHDLNHTMQAEKSLIQPFLKGCGPWIKYFQDHVIA